MTSKKRILVILFLCILGFGLWFLMNSPNRNELPFNQGTTSLKDAPSESAKAKPSTKENPDLERETLGIKNNLELIPETERLKVQVRHGVTKELMKNVTIQWQVVDKGSRTKEEDFEKLLTASENFQTTGNDGAIWVARPKTRNIEFQVNHGELYGRGYYWAEIAQEIATVFVFQDQTIRVHVQNHNGSPANHIRVSFAGENPLTGKSTEFHSAITNQEGIAVLTHMQLHRPHPKSSRGQDKLFIVACIASMNPPMRGFDYGKEMPHEVELKLPPLGYAQIRALQETGAPFPDGIRISLQGSRPGRPGTESLNQVFLRTEPIRGWNQKPLVQGAATFPVALQEHLEFALNLPDHQKHPWGSGLGPSLEGETKVFTLQIPEELCFLHLRLLDRNGNPLANQQAVANLLNSGWHERFRGATDAKGIFRIPIDNRKVSPSDEHREGKYPRALAVYGNLEHGVRITGIYPLDKDLDPGTNIGGNLVLGAALLAQGQVVDPQGRGLGAAQIFLRAEADFLDSPLRNLDGGETFWTNSKGQFQLWGNPGSGGIRLQVIRPPFLPIDSVFQAGNAEITVVMKPSSQQKLQVQLPMGAQTSALSLLFRKQNEGEPEVTTIGSGFPADGSPLDLSNLAEGRYSIAISLQGVNAPFFNLENLDFTSGATQDPRLLPLDLRPHLAVGEVQVYGIHGEPLKDFQYRFVGEYNRLFGQSGTPILFAKSSNQVQIWGQNSRATVVTLSSTRQEVHLQPAFQLQLQALAMPILPEGTTYSLFLSNQENQFRQIFSWSPQQLESIHLPYPGRYVLQVFAQYRLGDQRETKREEYLLLNGQDELGFEIPDSGGMQTVNVRMTQRP